jgi:short-subunit dehydrogenase
MTDAMTHPAKPQCDLSGRVVVITGASKGIGRAIALRLAGEGCALVLVARSEPLLQTLAEEIRERAPHAPPAHLEVADLGDPARCEALIPAIEAACGRIDVLVNNAGVTGRICPLHESTAADIRRTIDLNLTCPTLLTARALPGMIARRQGTVLNVNSIVAKASFPDWGPYCASKAGLHAIAGSVAEEQRGNGIRVLGLYLGAVDTPIWDTVEGSPGRDAMLTPEGVADAAAFMLTQPDDAFIPELVLRSMAFGL